MGDHIQQKQNRIDVREKEGEGFPVACFVSVVSGVLQTPRNRAQLSHPCLRLSEVGGGKKQVGGGRGGEK